MMFVLMLIGLIVTGVVLRGWAISTLWGWFLVPIGAPAIGINTAIGIAVIIGLFTHHLVHDVVKIGDKRSAADLFSTVVSRTVGAPLMALLVGWIVLLFA